MNTLLLTISIVFTFLTIAQNRKRKRRRKTYTVIAIITFLLSFIYQPKLRGGGRGGEWKKYMDYSNSSFNPDPDPDPDTPYIPQNILDYLDKSTATFDPDNPINVLKDDFKILPSHRTTMYR